MHVDYSIFWYGSGYSLSTILLIGIPACIIYICVCVCVCVCVLYLLYSSLDGHFGGFHILALVNKASAYIRLHISFGMWDFPSFRQIPPRVLPASYGRCVLKFLSNFHGCHSGCNKEHSWQNAGGSLLSTSWSVYFLCCLSGDRRSFSARWSSPGLDVRFLDDQSYRSSFYRLVAICINVLEKFWYSANFLVSFWFFRGLGCVSSWSVLDRNHLLDISFPNIISCSVGCPFFFFWLFRAPPAACGGSQARGQIRATASGLHHSHSNTGSEPHPWPTPQLMATPDA